MPNVVICGDKEFVDILRSDLESAGLSVSGIATSIDTVEGIVEKTQAIGIIVPTAREWVDNIEAVKRDGLQVFVYGKIKKDMFDKLNDSGVIVLSLDQGKAVRSVKTVLDRVEPTSFHYSTNRERPAIVRNRVDLLTRCTTAVTSTKGGVGKTSTAVNLAAATGMLVRQISESTGQELRVALLDLNPVGNVDHKFMMPSISHVRNPKTILGFSKLHKNSSFAAVYEVMNYHEPSNVHFLSAREPGKENISLEALAMCLDLIQKYFHFVFIDMGTEIDHPLQVMALDAASDILIVSDRDQSAVRLIKKWRDTIDDCCSGLDRVKLVVNNAHKDGGDINVSTILREVSLPFLVELPHSASMPKSFRKGSPVSLVSPDDPYSKEVMSLVQSLTGITTTAHRNKGVFSSMRKLIFK